MQPGARVLFAGALLAAVAHAAPSASLTSHAAMVVDWTTQHCPRFPPMPPAACVPDINVGCDPDVVDANPRAWWTPAPAGGGGGSVTMLGSVNLGSRAQRGPDLGRLTHTCALYANSTMSPDPAAFAQREWIESPIVLNVRGGHHGTADAPPARLIALTHVDYIDPRTGEYLYCATTLYASADDGASWAPAAPPPAHIVAVSPYTAAAVAAAGTPARLPTVGYGMPSSVVRSPRDGYYYALVLSNWGKDVLGQPGGLCAIRSAAPWLPGSWRAWGGEDGGFNVSLAASPFNATLDPAAHVCAPLVDSAGQPVALRHISLLWSSLYQRFLALGTAGGDDHAGWAFLLSDDAVHWDAANYTAVDPAGFLEVAGNGSVAPLSPMPGRFVTRAGGGTGTWWADPEGAYKYPVASCRPCPGLDACHPAQLPPAAFDALPNATLPFNCGLVTAATGYEGFYYPTLLDPTANGAGGLDPGFNVVGETAYLFLVGKQCASGRFDPSANATVCSSLDAWGRDVRDVLVTTLRFGA